MLFVDYTLNVYSKSELAELGVILTLHVLYGNMVGLGGTRINIAIRF